MSDRTTPWWRNRTKLPFVVFLVIGGYFLWTEHEANIVAYLPWILVLGCLGMHFFMHGGHGSGNSHGGDRDTDPKAGHDEHNER